MLFFALASGNGPGFQENASSPICPLSERNCFSKNLRLFLIELSVGRMGRRTEQNRIIALNPDCS